jgi:hypothetical protein
VVAVSLTEWDFDAVEAKSLPEFTRTIGGTG